MLVLVACLAVSTLAQNSIDDLTADMIDEIEGITTTTTVQPTAGCKDTISDCSKYERLCRSGAYRTVMTTQCPRTCNLCKHGDTGGGVVSGVGSSGVGSDVGCTDSNKNCVQWKNYGFCTNKFYTEAQRKSYCGATCKMCNTTP